MWNLKKGSIYVDNCGKTIDNTCKKGKLRQLEIPALSRNYQEVYKTSDDESQFTK